MPQKNRSLIISLHMMAVTLSNALMPYLGVWLYEALGADLRALGCSTSSCSACAWRRSPSSPCARCANRAPKRAESCRARRNGSTNPTAQNRRAAGFKSFPLRGPQGQPP